MKKYPLILILLLTTFAQSQNSKRLDSLLLEVDLKQKLPLVNILNEISWEFKNVNIDSAIYYANKSLKISNKLNDKKAIASSYNSLANCYDALGKLDSAQVYHNKSLDLKLQVGHLVGAADSYNNLGIVYDLKGDYALSLENYFKALKIYENEDVSFDKVPMVLGNIGIVYKKQKEYDKVLSYYTKALNIYEENNYDFGSVITKGNIGSVLINLKKFKESIKYSEEAKDLYAKLGYQRYVPYMITNIAIAKDSLKLYKEAQNDYKEAIKRYTKDQNLYELSYAQLGLAQSYIQQRRYTEAIAEINKSLPVIEEKGFKEFEMKAYKLLSESEYNLGNYKKAYDFNERYSIGKDSLFEENKTKTIFELEAKYENEKKQKEIVSQRANLAESELSLSKKNNLILGLCVLAVVIFLLGYLLFNQQKLKNKQLQKESELKEALIKIETQNKLQDQRLNISRDLHDNIGAQLTFIISSIDNLKYGFNIVNKELENKLSGISTFTKETIYELRDTIWAMNKSEISFEDLQARISNFIDKADIASKDIKFEFEIHKDVNTDKKFSSVIGMNLYRIIQESVNNAIKYAESNVISVNIFNEKSAIEIVIKDDGKGFDIDNVELGNGLNNIKKRAAEIQAILKIESKTEVGTKIKIKK